MFVSPQCDKSHHKSWGFVFVKWTILTDAISDFHGFRLAEHGDAAVTLLVVRACPVLVRILGHGGDVSGERLLSTLCLLQAQNVWILLPDPLQGLADVPAVSDTVSSQQSLKAWGCELTSRPFFLTQALSPSTFHDVIFILALRPSLLVILSGGSSYSIGASGSLVFLAFFGVAVQKEKHICSSEKWWENIFYSPELNLKH